jgi:hypothetical protein
LGPTGNPARFRSPKRSKRSQSYNFLQPNRQPTHQVVARAVFRDMRRVERPDPTAY